MKAIETRYNGHRFRSRLEARWAVFFDWLEVEWEYEPEGFELNNGTKYLPDFYLPKFEGGCWVEIKPYYGDWRKAAAFCFEANQPIWLAHGKPGNDSYTLLLGRSENVLNRNFIDPNDDIDEKELDLQCYFDMLIECVPCASEGRREHRMYWHAESEARAHDWNLRTWINVMAPNVAIARDAAKSARFEFGECGAG
jgi:hypothetical protein